MNKVALREDRRGQEHEKSKPLEDFLINGVVCVANVQSLYEIPAPRLLSKHGPVPAG